MAKTGEPARPPGWRHYLAPMAACLLLGLVFIAIIQTLNVPHAFRVRLPDVLPPPMPAAHAELAEVGAFLAYRGYAVLAMAVSFGVAILGLAAIVIFVGKGRTLAVVLAIFFAQLALALIGTLLGGSAMAAVADTMTCPAAAAEPWDFCSLGIGGARLQLGFDRAVEAVCATAATAAVFAILIVAASRAPRRAPAMIGGQERCVTLLMIAASALLCVRLLLHKGFLNWAFADFLAVERPAAAVTAYIGGTATFNAALDVALLGLTWFAALVLLERSGAVDEGQAAAGATRFSVYNISAIFAPVLSAIASSFLGG